MVAQLFYIIFSSMNFQSYDWYLKGDDDTFVVLENLRHFVEDLNPNIPIWFGYKLKHPRALKVLKNSE